MGFLGKLFLIIIVFICGAVIGMEGTLAVIKNNLPDCYAQIANFVEKY